MKKHYSISIIVSILWFLTSFSLSAQTTWYTLTSGDWNNPEIWTQDPAGAIPSNPTNSFPVAGDNVYINSGRTVTMPTGVSFNAEAATLTVDGRLELKNTSGHSFTTLRGSGRIVMEADNFPTVSNANHFITKGQGEGTAVFSGGGYSISTVYTFYNVDIELAGGTSMLTLASNLTVNGSLTLKKGTFNINSTTSRLIKVAQDVRVESTSVFNVGTSQAVHRLTIGGSLYNNGTIHFSNSAQYSAATNGAVRLTFTGQTHEEMVCNGITNLYRLIVDKGSDRTYRLDISSSAPSNFKLFGPVSGDTGIDGVDGPGGWERLPLVIYNGTLKLGSNINIDRLGANRSGGAPNEFHIPATAMLWIDGANVSSNNGVAGWAGTTIFGKLKVSAGLFKNPAGTGGITYFSNNDKPGTLEITGGAVETTQLKQDNTDGRFNYIQSGGEMRINALSDSRGSSAVFALPQESHVFNMSGGKIIISSVNTTTPNGVDIGVAEGNYNITGGTIEIQTPTSGVAGQSQFGIRSTAPFYNFVISNSGHTGTQGVTLQSDLKVLNDITLGSATTLTATGRKLSVGQNFNVTGLFVQTSGTLEMNGSGVGALYNNTGSELTINDFTIDKSSPSTLVYLSGANNITSSGNLLVKQGDLDLESVLLSVKGNISLEKGNISSSTTGKLTLNGGSQQTLYSEYGKNYSFGPLELNNTNSVLQVLVESDVKATSVNFARNQIVDINSYNFEITGALSKGASVTWGANNSMFRTTGKSSDGGLTLPITSGSNGTNIQFFPVGILDNTTNRYTPMQVDANAAISSNGSITMNPVNGYHPTVSDTDYALEYYWKVDQNGLDSEVNNIRYELAFDSNISVPSFIQWVIFEYKPTGNIFSNGEWLTYGNGVKEGTFLRFPFNSALSQDFTFGVLEAGFWGQGFDEPRTLYSRQNGDWDNRNTWSETGHGGNRLNNNDQPRPGDRIEIGNGHRINVSRDNNGSYTTIDIGELVFVHDTTSSSGIEDVPRLQVERGNRMNLNRVSGTGMITQWIDNSRDPILTGDFGSFVNEKYSWFLFVAAGSQVELPASIKTYPNVAAEGSGNSLTFTTDVQINGNLNPRGNSILQLSDGDKGDILIKGDLLIGDYLQGAVEFPGGSNVRTLTVEGDVDFTKSVSTPTSARKIIVSTGGSATHKFTVNGDFKQGVGTVDLFNTAGGSKVDLYFGSETNALYSRTDNAATIPDFHRIFINKTVGKQVDFQTDFTLNGTSNGSDKPLTLLSGVANLNHPGINITLSSGGNDFKIPASSTLQLTNGLVSISGTNTGLWLDGKLLIEDGGIANFNGGTNNYIEYTASGKSEMVMNGNGQLRVGSQVRRTLTSDAGILKFAQNGENSTVVIGDKEGVPSNGRGVFEIMGTGSSFTQAANSTITIKNNREGTSFPDLWLEPETFSTGEGSTIEIENGVASSAFELVSHHPFMNLTLTGNVTTTIKTLPLSLNGDLTIGVGATFNANALDVSLRGNLTNSGTYTAGGNTTIFAGSSAQSITGSTTFFNIVKAGSETLTLGDATTITSENNLRLEVGTINTGANDLNVEGNLTITEGTTTQSSGSSKGIVLNGSWQQMLQGGGNIGRLTIDNAAGVVVPTQSATISFTDALNLESGVLDIGRNLLTFSKDALIQTSGTFSENNMIQTNLSFTDAGIRKYFPVINTLTTYVYPIGSMGKYTPVTLNITANSNNTGYIRVKAANEPHISIPVADRGNVLQYNWTLDANGIEGLVADVAMQGYSGDVFVSAPNTAADYITARLLDTGEGFWNKYDTSTFDEDNTILNFTLGSDDAGIDGDYTAGVMDAIPDKVQEFVTVKDGDWTDAATWKVVGGGIVPGGGPRGAIVKIAHQVNMPVNYLAAYKTSIETNGVLNTGSTFGHRLGAVAGIGRLVLNSDAIPAGAYEQFLSAAGGTLEYSGSTNYSVLSEIPSANNLEFTGTGIRRFPNLDILLHGNMKFAADEVKNEHNTNISIKGNVTYNSGLVEPGYGTYTFNGISVQTISGTQTFTGSSAFNKLSLDNSAGLNIQTPLQVTNLLHFEDGRISSINGTPVLVSNASSTAITRSSENSFVATALQKQMNEGSDYEFPVGKDSRSGNIKLTGVSSSGVWEVEYFNEAPEGRDQLQEPIEYVSANEYWRVKSPATVPSASARVTLRWDSNSGVNPDDSNFKVVSNISTLGAKWKVLSFNNNDKSGSMSGGTVQTVPYSFEGSGRFTFGSSKIAAFSWIGAISSDWFTPGNWTNSTVPSASSNTTVGSVTNMPEIAGSNVAQVNNLIIEPDATLTLNPGGKLTVNGDLTIKKPGGLVIENKLGPNGLASLITKGEVIGKAEVKLQIEGALDRYYYLSSAVETPTYEELGVISSPFEGFRLDVYRKAQWITIHPKYNSSRLRSMEGFMVNNSTDGLINIDLTGHLNSGEIVRSFAESGWHLFGNPYPSAINWASSEAAGLKKENISPTIWYRTQIGTEMAFVTYNGETNTASYLPTEVNDSYTKGDDFSIIPPYQSVWIKAANLNGSITLNNGVRLHSYSESYSAPQLKSSMVKEGSNKIRILASNQYSRDATVLSFGGDYSVEFGTEDSEKYFNSSERIPEVFTKVGNRSIAINGLPELDYEADFNIPISVRNRDDSPVTLKFNLDEFSSHHSLALVDNETGDSLSITNGFAYTYTPNLVGENHNRFVVHFNSSTQEEDVSTSILDEMVGEASTHINIVGANGRAIVSIGRELLAQGPGKIEVYSVDGLKLSESEARTNKTFLVLPEQAGVYVVVVTASGERKVKKLLR